MAAITFGGKILGPLDHGGDTARRDGLLLDPPCFLVCGLKAARLRGVDVRRLLGTAHINAPPTTARACRAFFLYFHLPIVFPIGFSGKTDVAKIAVNC